MDTPESRSLRGVTLCHEGKFDEGIAELRAAIEAEPRNPAFHSNLGLMLHLVDRNAEAEASLKRALMLAPNFPHALANMSLVAKAAGDFAGAERAARGAIAADPRHVQARVNLAQALLAQGKFTDAWDHYRFTPDARVNLRDLGLAVNVAHVDRLPAPPAPLVLRGEQGLGDIVFFLRFAPLLAARGHRLAFWGDVRLHTLLQRTGLFEALLAPEKVPAPGLAVAWVGDLPGLLGITDVKDFPKAFPLAPLANRRDVLKARLATAGPPPYIGLTWRAGLAAPGRIVLRKDVPVNEMGAALAGIRGTFVSVQREPKEGENGKLEATLRRPVVDFSRTNGNLDEVLAVLDLLDDYVGVSNTNTHLRAGLGKGARVLVPFPPEWRWTEGPGRSPWFPDCEVYRQGAEGGWAAPLAALRSGLSAA